MSPAPAVHSAPMRTLAIAGVVLALSCGGGPAYDASQSVRLEKGESPSVEGHSLGVVSVSAGQMTLGIKDPDGTEREVTLKKGETLTLGDAIYVVVKVDGNVGVIAPKKPVEPEDFGGNGDRGGGGGGGW